MKTKLLLFVAIFTLVFSASASAQLRAYKFEFNDEYAGKQKCYLSLRAFDIAWDAASANVLFNCYESEVARTRNIEPRKIFILQLKDAGFLANVSKPITGAETGNPRVIVLSNWLWDLAETEKFIDDYSWSESQKKMVATKKSLTDLNAEQIDVPLEALSRGAKK